MRRNRKTARGTYALILRLPRAQTIRVGALGVFRFPRGDYIYVGSAMNGLTARLARHLRRAEKKLHWHVDYFLAHAQIKQVWTHQGAERFECVWAQAALAMPNARVIAPRFGASDCDCATHLVYFGKWGIQRRRNFRAIGRVGLFQASRSGRRWRNHLAQWL